MDDPHGFQGKTFGKYYLARLEARGGMGDVYLARLEGPLGFEKLVAIKIIHPHLIEDRRIISMFLDEARVTARIRHVNVCSILDFGADEEMPYIVMEYLDGVPLSTMLSRGWKGGGVPYEIAARTVADAARGLHAAHELHGRDGKSLGVVHRDVSPQNIFVLHEGAVKVLDFGIVRMRGRLYATKANEIKGKVPYMAPETLKKATVDRRVDVWSLGAILWEGTIGRTLFHGDDFYSSVTLVLETPIPRPSQLDPNYPPELERIVMSALERNPLRRTPTAEQMADDIEAYLYSTGQPWGPSQVERFLEQHFSENIQRSKELLTELVAHQPSVDDDFDDETVARQPVDNPPAPFESTGALQGQSPTSTADDSSQSVASATSHIEPPQSAERVQTIDSPVETTAFEGVPDDRTTEHRLKAAPRPLRAIIGLALGSVALLTIASVVFFQVYRTRSHDDPREASLSPTVGHTSDSARALAPPLSSALDGPSSSAPSEEDIVEGNDKTLRDESGDVDGGYRPLDAGSPEERGEPSKVVVTGKIKRPRWRVPRRPSPNPVQSVDRDGPSQNETDNRGTLNLLAIPNATVYWRGSQLGRTPIVEHPMPAGRHTLQLRPDGGGAARTITVVIQPGGTTRRTIKMR